MNFDIKTIQHHGNIEDNCYFYYVNLQNVEITNCKTIGENAFMGCQNISNINLPNEI